MRRKAAVSKAKKVQIFKWLLKKHRCTMSLEKDFVRVDGKKTKVLVPYLDPKDVETCVLIIDAKAKNSPYAITVTVPYKYNISYADILDEILRLMKKHDSGCKINDKWIYGCAKDFLKRGTTIEELAIEFDMTWRDMFTCYTNSKDA